MSRYTKTQVTQLSANEQAAINNINKNFDDIETAIKDTVSRSGSTPTHMTEDLDMNGKRIINLPAPKTDTDPVRRKDVVNDIALVQSLVNATTNAAAQTLKAAADVQEIIQDQNVGLVADDLALDANSKIRICGTNIDDITTVAGMKPDINTVVASKEDIEDVADNLYIVTQVANNKTNINTVASNISNVNTVAGVSADVATVASNNSNVTIVATNETNINAVAADLSNIDDVAAELPDIRAKANVSLDNLNTTGQGVIDSKLNVNLSNITNASKETIAGYGMPDYTAGVSVAYTDLNSGYTAPYDGVLLCNFSGNGTVTIGSNVFEIKQTGANLQVKEIHLLAGDFFQTTGIVASYGGDNMFFPLKGVNNA